VILDVAIGAGSAALGGAAGYGWYRLVGCQTGACPLTSNPWISSAYGAVLGLLVSGVL
jgi:hypothetical protein